MSSEYSRWQNKKVSQVERDNVTKGVNNLFTNPVDEYNINQGYLLEYGVIMDSWRSLKMYGINGNRNNPDFFINLIMLCETMMDLLSAKISEEEEKEHWDNIKGLYDKVDLIFRTNRHGEKIMYVQNANDLRHEISLTFRKLLREMQSKGLLTKVAQNQDFALNDIGE